MMTKLITILDQIVSLALEFRTAVVVVLCITWFVSGILVCGEERPVPLWSPATEKWWHWNRLRLELLCVSLLLGLVAAAILMRGPL